MKSLYVIQPYAVGSKNSKSLAIIIPAEVKKEFGIDVSTPFVLYPDKKMKLVTLQNMKGAAHIRNVMIPASESLAASSQQVPSALSRAQ